MLRIGCYTRKSVYSDTSDSTEVQYKLAVNYCNIHYENYEIIKYEDEGYSGASTQRPDFNRLISDIKSGFLDVVICYKLDRISRNIRDFSNFYAMLEELNVDFVCLKDNIDTSTNLGRTMMYISSVFSQFERETIAERVADNMIELAKSGKWTGGKAPTGYRLEKIFIDGKSHTTLVPNPDTLPFFNFVIDTFLEKNFSLNGLETYFRQNQIKSLNGKYLSSTVLYNLMRNPIYCTADKRSLTYFKELGCTIGCPEEKFNGQNGILIYGRTSGGKHKKHTCNPPNKWVVSVGLHKPLLSSDKWLAIQSRFGYNTFNKARKHKIGILKGILKCSCGYTMRTTHKVDKIYNITYEYYSCPNREKRGNEYCNMRAVKIEDIDNSVINLLKSISVDKSVIDSYVPNKSCYITHRSKSDILRNINNAETKICNLTSTLSSNSSSVAAKYIVSEIEALDKQITDLKRELLDIKREEIKYNEHCISKDEKYKIICDIVDNLDNADYDELTSIIKDLFIECIWDGKSLKLKL